MHYKDGTEAKVGDVVKGQGYNIKHDVVGIVLALKNEETCNITVSAFDGLDQEKLEAFNYHEAAKLTTEYGEAKAFDLVYRKEP